MITLKKNLEEYNPDYDFLKVNKDSDIRKIIRDEILYFSDNITKINHYGFSQKRQILVTNKAIYNLDNKSLKRKIEIKIVKGVSTSNSSDEFVIHCFELDHDYHYVSERKRKIIQFINNSYFFNKENFLPLCLIHNSSLTEYVTLKTDKKKDINFTKMPINSRMHVEEYLFGKINSESINKDISTSTIFDFKTISLIGRGSCSKIALVEHLSTNHLYVLKTIRKDFILDFCFLENIEVEKYVLTKIKHNFIINCFKMLENKERIYFLIPFIKGGDLYNYLQKEKVFDEER